MLPIVISLMFVLPDMRLWPKDTPSQEVHGPAVNQIGYLPSSSKIFAISAVDVSTGANYQVISEFSHKSVFKGKISEIPVDDSAVSGDKVLYGDFSALNRLGKYHIVIGKYRSGAFVISDTIYRSLYRDSARAFYLIRSGVAIDDPITGVKHKPSHMRDALVEMPGQPKHFRDLTGGWYNAGDFGKWVHMGAITTSYMMFLQELNGSVTGKISLQIPRSKGDKLPDLLNNARWGLEWMLKMQNDDGGVLHKVDSGPRFSFGKLPEDDPEERVAIGPSSLDAANFCAAMLIAARVYQKVEPEYSTRCYKAAIKSWKWLCDHPNVTHNDPFYVDNDASGETLWALAEMVCSTGDKTLDKEFIDRASKKQLQALSWQDPAIQGYFDIARSDKVSIEAREIAKSEIVRVAKQLIAKADRSGYKSALAKDEYLWESMETLLHRGAALVYAYELTHDEMYRKAALEQLNYALGVNALHFSFITGYGINCARHPYNWIYAAQWIAIPGWAAGGPNYIPDKYDADLVALSAKGVPPSKCYLDGHSYSSNEGETSENAALVFLSGYFTK